MFFQMEVIVGDFGIVVVPRDGADTERIMNHSSVLRKHKVPNLKCQLYFGCLLLVLNSTYTATVNVFMYDIGIIGPFTGEYYCGKG